MNNNKRSFFFFFINGLFIVCLAGCQSLGGSSADPALTKGHSAEFFSKSAWQACATGAAVSGLGCVLLGGKTATCLISAAAGCGVAMGVNYYMDAKRAEYANEQDRLDAYIADVRRNTAEVRAVSESAQAVLDKNQQTLTNLNKQIANQSVDKANAQKQLSEIDANISYLNDKLVLMKEAERDWHNLSLKEQNSGMPTAQLNAQIAQMNKEIAVLEKQIDIIAKQRSAVRVS